MATERLHDWKLVLIIIVSAKVAAESGPVRYNGLAQAQAAPSRRGPNWSKQINIAQSGGCAAARAIYLACRAICAHYSMRANSPASSTPVELSTSLREPPAQCKPEEAPGLECESICDRAVDMLDLARVLFRASASARLRRKIAR